MATPIFKEQRNGILPFSQRRFGNTWSTELMKITLVTFQVSDLGSVIVSLTEI